MCGGMDQEPGVAVSAEDDEEVVVVVVLVVDDVVLGGRLSVASYDAGAGESTTTSAAVGTGAGASSGVVSVAELLAAGVRFLCVLGNGLVMSALHDGQIFLNDVSHWSTSATWNRWPQGRIRTRSPTLNASRQIAHSCVL